MCLTHDGSFLVTGSQDVCKFGQLNPYSLCLVLVLDGSSGVTSLQCRVVVGLVCRTLAMVMAGRRGKRERGNSNTDRTQLSLRPANGTVAISFLACAASS